jgi:hypothetical protein
MEDDRAIDILTELVKKDSLTKEEREALKTALGVLLLTVRTSESYLKHVKAKRSRLENTD